MVHFILQCNLYGELFALCEKHRSDNKNENGIIPSENENISSQKDVEILEGFRKAARISYHIKTVETWRKRLAILREFLEDYPNEGVWKEQSRQSIDSLEKALDQQTPDGVVSLELNDAIIEILREIGKNTTQEINRIS